MIRVFPTTVAAHLSIIGPQIMCHLLRLKVRIHTLDPYQPHPKLVTDGPRILGRFTQFPQSGYVTPGSSRSNSSSSLYPGPVHGTNIVPSPLVPSPARSKTPDGRSTKSAARNKAWQVGVSSSTSGSSTCTFPLSRIQLVLFADPSHHSRRPRAITHAVSSPCPPFPHAPTDIVYTTPPCTHLLRYRLYSVCAYSRGSNDPRTRTCRDPCPTGDRAPYPSELSAGPALPKTPLGCQRWADRFPADLLHRQGRREAQDQIFGGPHQSRRTLRGTHLPHDLRHLGGVELARGGFARSTSGSRGLQKALYAHGRRMGRWNSPTGLARFKDAFSGRRD
jgi:hypothetical protein